MRRRRRKIRPPESDLSPLLTPVRPPDESPFANALTRPATPPARWKPVPVRSPEKATKHIPGKPPALPCIPCNDRGTGPRLTDETLECHRSLSRRFSLRQLAAFAITLVILLKTLLMLLDTAGIIAPAATATNPTIKAYSIKSCPCSSRQMVNWLIALQYLSRIRGKPFIFFMLSPTGGTGNTAYSLQTRRKHLRSSNHRSPRPSHPCPSASSAFIRVHLWPLTFLSPIFPPLPQLFARCQVPAARSHPVPSSQIHVQAPHSIRRGARSPLPRPRGHTFLRPKRRTLRFRPLER